MAKVIFIGGTGRSGTNILKEILSKNSMVAVFPFEYRFIIDPDGIIDFYSSYSGSWSPYMADVRIKRLEKLLRDVSGDNKSLRYAGWELEKWIRGFSNISAKLVSDLKQFSYPAIWPGMENGLSDSEIYYSSPKTKEELAKIFNAYLSDIFISILENSKADVFVEDNTWNMLFSKEISEIYPEAKFVHVYRDPRDVVASLVKQRWSPKNASDAAIYLKDILSRWLKIKEKLPKESFIEVKFEELIKNPKRKMLEICDFCKINFKDEMLSAIDIRKSHIGRWKNEFSEEEKKEVQNILADEIIKMGYGE